MKKIFICVMLAMVIVVCASCVTSNDIVGTWTAQTTVLGETVKTTFVFNDDNTGRISAELGVSSEITYKLRGNTLAVTTSAFGFESTINYSVAFEGDTMTLTNLDDAGEILSFTKGE